MKSSFYYEQNTWRMRTTMTRHVGQSHIIRNGPEPGEMIHKPLLLIFEQELNERRLVLDSVNCQKYKDE